MTGSKKLKAADIRDVAETRVFPSPAAIYDPVARMMDAMGDRWSLVLVRQLLIGPKGFQELRQRTGIAPRVLSGRLKELTEIGFIHQREEGGYELTDLGKTLEPVVASIAQWFTRHGMSALQLHASQFTDTTPQSVLESLPFLVREDRAKGANVTFEVRLTGDGGGVWTVQIQDGKCFVQEGFAENADARYTASARAWCGVALGLTSAREMIEKGLMSKEGKPAMDYYFHQIARGGPVAGEAATSPEESQENLKKQRRKT